MARDGTNRGRPKGSGRFDWTRIRSDYETGTFSVPMLAEKYGASRQAIHRHMAEEGWTIGSSSKAVANRTREKVIFTDPKVAREDAIEAAATANARIIREHQRVAGRGRDLALRLLQELEETTGHLPTLEELVEIATTEDKTGLRAKLIARLGTGSRAVAMRDIATAVKTWVDVERTAFNLDGEKEDDLGKWTDERIAARLAELLRKAGAAPAA
ncbi:MAG: hypothetical protein J0H00_10870 [Burkholderiales bacterium]|nr:hypothetical protein [Burkholderiales bacterium]